MFDEIHPAAARFRNHRAVASSVLVHLGLLAAILFHRPPVIELIPLSLANGSGTQSYRVIYAPPDGQDIGPRDRRAQEIGEHSREEHGQDQAAGQPGEGGEAAPREEPARLHDGPGVSGGGPGSIASTGTRRA